MKYCQYCGKQMRLFERIFSCSCGHETIECCGQPMVSTGYEHNESIHTETQNLICIYCGQEECVCMRSNQ